jgi:hypothetical protein
MPLRQYLWPAPEPALQANKTQPSLHMAATCSGWSATLSLLLLSDCHCHSGCQTPAINLAITQLTQSAHSPALDCYLGLYRHENMAANHDMSTTSVRPHTYNKARTA